MWKFFKNRGKRKKIHGEKIQTLGYKQGLITYLNIREVNHLTRVIKS